MVVNMQDDAQFLLDLSVSSESVFSRYLVTQRDSAGVVIKNGDVVRINTANKINANYGVVTDTDSSRVSVVCICYQPNSPIRGRNLSRFKSENLTVIGNVYTIFK